MNWAVTMSTSCLIFFNSEPSGQLQLTGNSPSPQGSGPNCASEPLVQVHVTAFPTPQGFLGLFSVISRMAALISSKFNSILFGQMQVILKKPPSQSEGCWGVMVWSPFWQVQSALMFLPHGFLSLWMILVMMDSPLWSCSMCSSKSNIFWTLSTISLIFFSSVPSGHWQEEGSFFQCFPIRTWRTRAKVSLMPISTDTNWFITRTAGVSGTLNQRRFQERLDGI